jgi:hypothetical protein
MTAPATHITSFLELSVAEQQEHDRHDASCRCADCCIRLAIEAVKRGELVGAAELDLTDPTVQNAIREAKAARARERERQAVEVDRYFAAIWTGRRRR